MKDNGPVDFLNFYGKYLVKKISFYNRLLAVIVYIGLNYFIS